MKKNKAKKVINIIFLIFALLFTLLNLIIFFTMDYIEKNIGLVSIDEVIFHLKVPLQGTSRTMIRDIIFNYVVPAMVIFLIVLVPYLIRFKHKSEIEINIFQFKLVTNLKNILIYIILFINILVLPFQLIDVEKKFHVIDYIKLQKQNSTFIEEHYVDPKNIKITFPEQKRNLIYVYLESMETTYMDIEHGGNQDINLIPELTELALVNDNFSNDNLLGGAIQLNGTGWTMGGMVAQTSGIPLNLPFNANLYDKYDSFLPGAYNLGDILYENGYKNVLMIGSDSRFAGKDKFFKSHGNYDIKDYRDAINEKIIDKNHYENWGMADSYLFKWAKKELKKLSKGNQPFNLTLLTVNTHFPDGFVEDGCETIIEGNQYANSIACSSKEVADFVNWIQEQDFYENTTIIIFGDHLTMADNPIAKYGPNNRTVYNAIINSAVSANNNKNRVFSTMDMFPTTLASLGANIEGNKLGLGINLYSNEKTLLEEYGISTFNTELAKRSVFYNDKILYGK